MDTNNVGEKREEFKGVVKEVVKEIIKEIKEVGVKEITKGEIKGKGQESEYENEQDKVHHPCDIIRFPNLKFQDFFISEENCLQNTWDCNAEDWFLPMAPFVCSHSTFESWEQVSNFINCHIKDYPFVKFCNLSPKDWKSPPVFNSTHEAVTALQNSERTTLGFHIVMKKKRNYIGEARCFISGDKVTCVIGNIEKEKVQAFLNQHKFDIPFSYCCLEIGLYYSDQRREKIEVIEINFFGELCSPHPLTWEENWYDLIFRKETLWISI